MFHIREAGSYGSPERLIVGQITHARNYNGIPVSYRKGGIENPFVSELTALKIPHLELTEHFTGDLTTSLRLAAMIRQYRPALIVTHEYKSNLYGYVASRITGVPHLVHFHGVTAEDVKVRLYNAIDRWVLKRSTGIITVSNETKAKLCGLGIAESRIEVVFNAVSESALDAKPFQKNAEFASSVPLAVCAARFSHEKGIDLLVEAAALLKETGDALNVLIYGAGPEEERIRSLIRDRNLEGRIKLAGFVPDLRGVFGAMDFLVIPSRSEGFPLVLLEAWAQGAPVVATPVGGLPNLIDDNGNGILARSTDAASLAEAIRRALATTDFRSRCGSAGRRLVQEKYNFERQVQLLEETYDRIVSETAVRSHR
jgi:glycosyltransferase involved in cell wall biosynthesis